MSRASVKDFLEGTACMEPPRTTKDGYTGLGVSAET